MGAQIQGKESRKIGSLIWNVLVASNFSDLYDSQSSCDTLCSDGQY
jgi:hypothetical protein